MNSNKTSGRDFETTKPYVTFEQDFSQLKEIEENQEKKILHSNEIARFLEDISSLIDESLEEIENLQFQSCIKLILKVLSVKLGSSDQESSKSHQENQKAITKCEKQIQNLIQKFPCDNEDMFTLMKKLIACRFHFIQTFFLDEKNRLYKFAHISMLLKSVLSKDNNQTLKRNFKHLHDMLDEVLMEIYQLKQTDLKERSKQVAWYLSHYGLCCNDIKEYKKCIDLQKKAISIMEFAHSRNADTFKVFGHCLSNIARAYELMEDYEEAKNNYEAAHKAYENALDIKKNKREENLSNCQKYINRVSNLLN